MLNEQKAKEQAETTNIKKESVETLSEDDDFELDDFFTDDIKEEPKVEVHEVKTQIEIPEDEQRELKKYNELLELYGIH